MSKQERINEIKSEMEKIHDMCNKVYGTTTDGSFGACLYGNGYGKLKKELEELEGGEQ